MGFQDSVNGLSFIKQGLDQLTEYPYRTYRGVNTTVSRVRMIGIVSELIKSAAVLRAPVAGPRGTVSSGTGELNKSLALNCADPVEPAMCIGGTFKRKPALVCKLPVQLNLFANCRLILTQKISHGFLTGSIIDPSLNDLTITKSKMRLFIGGFHKGTFFREEAVDPTNMIQGE